MSLQNNSNLNHSNFKPATRVPCLCGNVCLRVAYYGSVDTVYVCVCMRYCMRAGISFQQTLDYEWLDDAARNYSVT